MRTIPLVLFIGALSWPSWWPPLKVPDYAIVASESGASKPIKEVQGFRPRGKRTEALSTQVPSATSPQSGKGTAPDS